MGRPRRSNAIYLSPKELFPGWVSNHGFSVAHKWTWAALQKMLVSYDLPSEFVRWREIAHERNRRRTICVSELSSATKETPINYRQDPHEYKNNYSEITDGELKPTRKWLKILNSQFVRLEKLEELQPHHNHEQFLYFDCADAFCTIRYDLLVINLTKSVNPFLVCCFESK
jgi:hypothetical protein